MAGIDNLQPFPRRVLHDLDLCPCVNSSVEFVFGGNLALEAEVVCGQGHVHVDV